VYNLDELNAPCELTTGKIVCGNLSRALKDRKRNEHDIIMKQAAKRIAMVSFYYVTHNYFYVIEVFNIIILIIKT